MQAELRQQDPSLDSAQTLFRQLLVPDHKEMAPKVRDEEEGLLLAQYNSADGESQPQRSMSNFVTTTVAVEGMTCGACTSALEGALCSKSSHIEAK